MGKLILKLVLKKIVKKLDKDLDGKVSVKEVKAEFDKVFTEVAEPEIIKLLDKLNKEVK